MADYLTTDTELTSVANAIRTKGGTSAPLVYPTGFVSAIQAIPTGGTLQSNKTVTPTTSQQVVTPDSGYDGLEQVTVNAMPQGSVKVQDQIAGALVATASVNNGAIILSETINLVPVVTASGYVTSGTSNDVSVTLASLQPNLVASNIKKDVVICGITGSYEASGGGLTDLSAAWKAENTSYTTFDMRAYKDETTNTVYFSMYAATAPSRPSPTCSVSSLGFQTGPMAPSITLSPQYNINASLSVTPFGLNFAASSYPFAIIGTMSQ